MLCGIISVFYLTVTSILFLFPTELDNGRLTFAVFNYTPIVLFFVMVIATIYWWLPAPYGARHFFEGPKKKASDVSMIGSSKHTSKVIVEDLNKSKVKKYENENLR